MKNLNIIASMGKDKKKFINPFDKGVTYEMFLDSVSKDVDLDSYLKGKCKPEQIAWLKDELKQFKIK